ncbi:hypothetical protein BU23DRAFT_449886 [Bimuria novae-zelandiae CBS 107.79]|uniref:DUF7820 domain-containing protein n=1 Tax=Bimuria novae-zelandiae CBS 107.79 TaxID=1447943 RepID=A0A6A5VRQ4_9PLEO|nr:hypothetical protein BU23DRAFT_449886 [Bimuria novae-zelandiae CBS 107.79]
MATRNSIAKVPYGLDTASQKGQQQQCGAHQRGPSSQATPLYHRESVSSTASFATMANSDGPFGSGPSHPYAMYPQNTMARNASISTTATQQPQQRSLSPPLQTGPSHPYGMYSQNTVEDETPVPPVQSVIPVGFPGINTGFHRQIGPDGEEQDIVGPFGHTEQLPPYSRYPEEGPTKASMAAEASATPVESRSNPMAASNIALPINAEPPVPPPPASPISPLASIAPALLPQQRPETQTGNAAPRPATTNESASLLTSEEGAVVEKAEEEPSVKKANWRCKRLWGKIPLTVVIALLVLLLIFAIVLGAAIGTFVTKNRDKSEQDNDDHSSHDRPELQTTGNTLFGATPISTPSSLAPLPTGQFSLPLGFAQESSPGCLLVGNQYAAWSCKMSFAPLQVVVNSTSEGYQASLQAWVAPDGSIQYGLQAPVVPPAPLQLVTDLDYKGYGPAWHFSSRYDKVVVLQRDEFIAGQGLRKRTDPSFRYRFQVQPGDNPWYCVWNSTYIEGYIYVTDNSTAATMTNTTPIPDASEEPFASLMTATPTLPISTPEFPSTTPPPTRRTLYHRQDGPNFRFPYPYPRIVKIEERRLPGAPQPYCQKMQLLDNGQIAPASDSNGGSVLVYLQESDPHMSDFFGAPPGPPSASPSDPTKKRRSQQIAGRGDPSDACHCQWMFQ